ncbi:MAG: 16S rRNA (cytosine(1402)-N(4))-methyltransferase RsmH [Bacteroidales bacterium]
MSNNTSLYHTPVLLHESIDALDIKPNGTYVDITFGGGGHSLEILRQLGANGRLVAFDQDQDAKKNAEAIADNRLTLIHGNFRFLTTYLRYNDIRQVDGLLGDLGVSSHQFDTAERGFSFRFEAELDMRMNHNSPLTAAEVISNFTQEQLEFVFSKYGEIDNARRLTKLLIEGRNNRKVCTIGSFLEIIKPALPKVDEAKYLAKVFQALRIEVNGELRALSQLLTQLPNVVKKDGKIVFITYHSLEDRLTKKYIKNGIIDSSTIQKDIYGNTTMPFKAINKKVILPTNNEIEQNPRSRSAKLRIAQRR